MAFLKYRLIITFLLSIEFLMNDTSPSCNYNEKMLRGHYEGLIERQIGLVKAHLENKFQCSCKDFRDVRDLSADMCSSSTMGNRTNKSCYNLTRMNQTSCQIKNLVYLGCVLNHYIRNIKSNSTEEMSLLKENLELLDTSFETLCINISRKKRQKRTRSQKEEMASSRKCRSVCKITETLNAFSHHWQRFMGTMTSVDNMQEQ